MGVMINGEWNRSDELRFSEGGRLMWSASPLRHWIGSKEFPAEAGRYHLYIMEVCPWAHRTWLTRALKGLQGVVSMSRCVPRMTEDGWVFDPDDDRYRDHVGDRAALREVYAEGAPGYSGRVTVPVLFDIRSGRIVNNESADIVRMLDTAFAAVGASPLRLVPDALRDEIDAMNRRIHEGLNRAVYRAGFARNEPDHVAAVHTVFDTLTWMNGHLASRRYLVGSQLTEADVRAFPTLVRFDAAYYSAFGCSLARLSDFEHVWAYARDLYRYPGFAETVMPLELYRRTYHGIPYAVGHRGIVSPMPRIDFTAPSHRERLSA